MTAQPIPNIANQRIVGPDGVASQQFARVFQDVIQGIEGQISDITTLQAQQAAQLALINANVAAIQVANNSLVAQVTQLQSVTDQVAQALANAADAQATADTAGGSSAVSGNAQTSGNTVTTSWTRCVTVSLVGVVAGNLTASIVMSTSAAGLPNGSPTYTGNYRIVEDTGVEVTVFTGNLSVSVSRSFDDTHTLIYYVFLSNDSQTSLNALNDPRASSGALSYHLDLKLNSGSLSNTTTKLTVRRS